MFIPLGGNIGKSITSNPTIWKGRCTGIPVPETTAHSGHALTARSVLLYIFSHQHLVERTLWVLAAEKCPSHGERWHISITLRTRWVGTTTLSCVFLLSVYCSIPLYTVKRELCSRTFLASVSSTGRSPSSRSRKCFCSHGSFICSASPMPSCGARERGLRDRESALALLLPERCTIFRSRMPEPYTFVHHRACFPLGFGVRRTAVYTVTSWP